MIAKYWIELVAIENLNATRETVNLVEKTRIFMGIFDRNLMKCIHAHIH